MSAEINKIYNEDCFDYLKRIETESVNVCLTDPPYMNVVDEDWDKQWKSIDDYVEWSEVWISEVSRILKKSGSFYIFGFPYQLARLLPIIEKYGFKFRQDIVIWKGMKSAAGRISDKLKMFPTTTEHIYFFVKNNNEHIKTVLQKAAEDKKLTPREINEYLGKSSSGGGTWSTLAGKKQKRLVEPTRVDWEKLSTLFGGLPAYDDMVFKFNLPMGLTDVFDDINFYIPKERKFHPTQKPMELIDRLVKCSTDENDTIIDPFMGSGTLAVSCKKLNRNFLGCEKDNNFYNICNLRLETNDEYKLPIVKKAEPTEIKIEESETNE
jgi:site-specific DNA-methyltransferase (adenine-specific)